MSKGWHGDKQAHSLASKGIKTSIPNKAYGELRKEFVKLNKDIYSDNKVKIKKLYKERGLEFNKKEYHQNSKFIWENETERVELIVSNNVATIYWQSKDDSELLNELKEKTKEFGGVWEVENVDENKERDTKRKEIKSFDSKNLTNMINNERDARFRGFNHCPILKPMIKEYIENREEKTGKVGKTYEEVEKYVYDYVDKRYPHLKDKKDDWDEEW